MRPLRDAVSGGIAMLLFVTVAGAQAPPAVVQPGTPGAPEVRGMILPPPGPPPATVPPPESGPRPAGPAPDGPAGGAGPSYTIHLGPRHACVTPNTRGLARAEGGSIDVTTPSPDTLAVAMTGTAAANSYLGCTGTASEVFELVQEFEITASDPAAKAVVLTLESTLTGFVRGRRTAGACVRVADMSVVPAACPGTPLVALAHPPLCVAGTGGRLCNQHLPPRQGPPVPPGRYTLIAHFVIDATAGGLCDSHAVTDFSPDTTLPADWVRVRDPFQGVSKRAFGFAVRLRASAPTEAPPLAAADRPRPPTRQARYVPAPSPSPTASAGIP